MKTKNAFISFLMIVVMMFAGTSCKKDSTSSNEVSIVNDSYSPSSITVKKGTAVKWTNNDSDQHSVTSDGGSGPLNSGTINPGGTYSFTANTVGTFPYHCTFHNTMFGTLIVTN
jgi:plastocyanin